LPEKIGAGAGDASRDERPASIPATIVENAGRDSGNWSTTGHNTRPYRVRRLQSAHAERRTSGHRRRM